MPGQGSQVKRAPDTATSSPAADSRTQTKRRPACPRKPQRRFRNRPPIWTNSKSALKPPHPLTTALCRKANARLKRSLSRLPLPLCPKRNRPSRRLHLSPHHPSTRRHPPQHRPLHLLHRPMSESHRCHRLRQVGPRSRPRIADPEALHEVHRRHFRRPSRIQPPAGPRCRNRHRRNSRAATLRMVRRLAHPIPRGPSLRGPVHPRAAARVAARPRRVHRHLEEQPRLKSLRIPITNVRCRRKHARPCTAHLRPPQDRLSKARQHRRSCPANWLRTSLAGCALASRAPSRFASPKRK